jgi:hypothetical protein
VDVCGNTSFVDLLPPPSKFQPNVYDVFVAEGLRGYKHVSLHAQDPTQINIEEAIEAKRIYKVGNGQSSAGKWIGE